MRFERQFLPHDFFAVVFAFIRNKGSVAYRMYRPLFWVRDSLSSLLRSKLLGGELIARRVDMFEGRVVKDRIKTMKAWREDPILTL